MEDFDGQIIRDYQFTERIGSGGYGVIYKAFQPGINREVAVKIIHSDHLGEPGSVERFEGEAQLVAQLEHPHIVPLYNYWHDDKGMFLVMRYLRGGSLRDALRQQKTLSLPLVLRVVEQIADALSSAHNAGVVHRDIKPDNILLDGRGNAYLTDFGIARHFQQVDTDITDPDGLIGTPAYVSPEEIRGDDITTKADIYSFGVLLYEMLTGEHPFPGANIGMMFNNHLSTPLPLLRDKRPDLPSALDNVIQRATVKNPAERYQDMLELATDFRSAVTDRVDGKPDKAPASTTFATPEDKVEEKVDHATLSLAPADSTPSTPKVSDRAATTEEARFRSRLIENMYNFWIKSVLDHSYYGPTLVNLRMEYVDGAVQQSKNPLLRKTLPLTLSDSVGILDVFDVFNGKFLILGDPGSGKTTRLLELVRSLLNRAKSDNAHPIPVVLNLSSWAERRKPIEKWLLSELTEKYEIAPRIARSWIDRDMLTLLLDGLDEVRTTWQEACIEAINTYRQHHLLVDIVVCSRVQDYNNLTNRLTLNGAIMVKPLEDTQIEAYLTNIGPQTRLLAATLKQDKVLREMSRSPLILNVMAQVYQGGLGISITTLPKAEREQALRNHLFEKYIDYVIKHREEESAEAAPYSKQDTVHFLSTLAWQIVATTQTIFYVDSLSPLWLPTNLQVLLYRLLSVLANTLLLNISFFGTLALIFAFRLDKLDLLTVFVFMLLLDALANIVLYFSMPDPFNPSSKRPPSKRTLRRKIYTLVAHYWFGGLVGGGLSFVVAQWNHSPLAALSTLAGGMAGMVTQALYTQRGQDYIAHYVLRLVMFVTGQIPLELTPFLKYAVSINLLRKVGDGYIFMHRYLLEYFADLRRVPYLSEQIGSPDLERL